MVGRGIAWGGVSVAAVAVAVLHVAGAGRVDPVARTVSDYVALPEGAALLGLAAAGLVTAGFAAAATLNAAARRVLLVWGAAVLLVAVFPTNLPDQPVDTAALVHRWAGALVFALPPVAGAMAARDVDAVRRRRLLAGAVAAAIGSAAFLLAHAPHVLAGADVFGWLGLVERVAYVALLVQLVLLAPPRTVSPGMASAGSASPGSALAGSASAGTVSPGVASAGVASAGVAPPGSASPGSASPRPAPAGSAPAGSAPAGSAPAGSVPSRSVQPCKNPAPPPTNSAPAPARPTGVDDMPVPR